jgi:uncharacterized protein
MLKDLPAFIDLKHLALQDYHLKGQVALAQMSRLRDNLCETQGEVHVDWTFTIDKQQRPTITGYLQAQLPMQCQRCLQPMQWPIDTQVALVVLAHGQSEDDLPVGYEALNLTSVPVSLITLVEDELILALPIVAMHTTCPFNEYQVTDSLEKEFTNQHNPFHILAKLKKQ